MRTEFLEECLLNLAHKMVALLEIGCRRTDLHPVSAELHPVGVVDLVKDLVKSPVVVVMKMPLPMKTMPHPMKKPKRHAGSQGSPFAVTLGLLVRFRSFWGPSVESFLRLLRIGTHPRCECAGCPPELGVLARTVGMSSRSSRSRWRRRPSRSN